MVEPLGNAHNLRRKRRTIVALVTVLPAANGLAALTHQSDLQIAIAVTSVIAVLVIAALKTRELRIEQTDRLESLLRTPIERVRDLSPGKAGVAPEAPQALTSIGRAGAPEYLSRDIDEELDGALAKALEQTETSLIVVSGPSKAGKTRALYEAMQRQLPDAHLVAPADADAIDELIAPGALPPYGGEVAVLWLDDLETYLRVGQHGMHPGVLDRLSGRSCKFLVLATEGGKGVQLAGDNSEFSVPMTELLRHATTIRLSSALSEQERRTLEKYAPEAAERIAEDGIGEYMIAAPELESKLTSGCHSPGRTPSPHGQAIAFAAIDWRRAGIADPIPREVLRDAYPSYLPGHIDPSDDSFSDGLNWAREPLYSTVALLSGHDEFQPHDHIVAYVDASPGRELQEQAWLHFFDCSTDEQAFLLGSAAHQRGRIAQDGNWPELAERAVRRAMNSDDPAVARIAAFNLGVLCQERGDLEGAEEAYRLADERGEPSGAINLGSLLQDRGELDEAEAAYRRAHEGGNPTGTFNLGNLLLHRGNLLREKGDFEGAEEAYRHADELGNAHAACNLGRLLKKKGDFEGAEEAYRHADELGSAFGAFKLGSYLWEKDDLEGAEAAFHRADERGDADGAFNFGVLLFKRGDRDGAESALRRADDRGHPRAPLNLATLLFESGDEAAAVAAIGRAMERDPESKAIK